MKDININKRNTDSYMEKSGSTLLVRQGNIKYLNDNDFLPLIGVPGGL